MERTRPEYPGMLAQGIELPTEAEAAAVFRALLDADGPVGFGPEAAYPLPARVAEHFNIRSQLAMSLHPKGVKPWMFVLHQCSYPRVWTREESRLFQEIGRRIADGLTSLLFMRDLRESEAKYRRFVETSNEGICALDGNVRITYVNDRTSAMIGYSSDEMLGRPLSDFMFEEDVAGYELHMAARRQGVAESYEYRFRRKDGSELWLLISASAIQDEEGKFQGSFSMFSDITERKQKEDRLALLSFALNNVHEAAFLIDEHARFHFINEEACRILGYSREELLLLSVADVDPDWPAAHWPEHWQQLAKEKSLTFEGRHRSRDGRIFPVEINANFIEYANREYNLALVRDITQRKHAERELALSEEKFSVAFRASPNLMAITSPENGRIVEINESFCRFFGYAREECLGRSTMELNMWVDPEQRTAAVRELDKTGAALYMPVELRTKSGEIRSVIDSMVFIDIGDQKHLLSVATDITQRKRAEERLHESLVETIRAIALVVEKRDLFTAGHQYRVARLCEAIAAELGLDAERIEGLRLGAMIHDIGNVYVPAEILSRPGSLSKPEFGLVKSHPQVGYEILCDIKFPWPVAEMVLQHHERLDGSGYPAGLKGEEIMLEARIIAVADVVEAMSSHRPYRPALGIDAALQEIKEHSGTKYDPAVVDACLHLLSEGHFDFESNK